MAQSSLTLKLLPELFGILKLPPTERFPAWVADAPLFFAARTSDELSVMCPQAIIPAGLAYSANWHCLRVHGELAFDEVGVAARLARPLAEAGLSIFVVSTHDRDYVFVARDDLPRVISAYEGVGFHILKLDTMS
ncbi:MAG: ACT domain-containing protein [Chloroflexi bacterium]|nr:ACT domain-containing protein [Chloroflexota bacterium]MCC6896002.1 ACT domain-containing protein [Anaerolineae bacterium]